MSKQNRILNKDLSHLKAKDETKNLEIEKLKKILAEKQKIELETSIEYEKDSDILTQKCEDLSEELLKTKSNLNIISSENLTIKSALKNSKIEIKEMHIEKDKIMYNNKSLKSFIGDFLNLIDHSIPSKLNDSIFYKVSFTKKIGFEIYLKFIKISQCKNLCLSSKFY